MDQKQLFLDAFIAYHSAVYSEDPEMLALFTGLTLAEVTFPDLTGVKQSNEVPSLTSESRNFQAAAQTFTSRQITDTTSELVDVSGLTVYGTVEELIAVGVGTRGVLTTLGGVDIIVEVAASDATPVSLEAAAESLVNDQLTFAAIERDTVVSGLSSDTVFEGYTTAMVAFEDTFVDGTGYTGFVLLPEPPAEIPAADIGQL